MVTVASRLLPQHVLQLLDRARAHRFLLLTAPATNEYVRRHGLEVRHGPFVGMRYIDGLQSTSGDLVAKLLGLYERELTGVVEEWLSSDVEHFIDIGCAEGYYAVGFAFAKRDLTVHAYDTDSTARARCAALAQLNDVGSRVHIGGQCDPRSFAQLPEHGVALLSDCEGAEKMILDPELAPRLRGWQMLVELHDFIDPAITETIQRRFASTHDIEMIDGVSRNRERPAELAFTTARQRSALLSERRPEQMRWAHLRPMR